MHKTTTSTKWYPVKEHNQWGHLSYTKNGAPFTKESRPDGPLSVKFPSGTKVKGTLTWRLHFEQVSDHGDSYPVRSRVPMFEFTFRGLAIEVRLSTSGLKVE